MTFLGEGFLLVWRGQRAIDEYEKMAIKLTSIVSMAGNQSAKKNVINYQSYRRSGG
jgi:hypothetical protein